MLSYILYFIYLFLIVYIYNLFNIENYKFISCIYLNLLVSMFFLLDIKIIIFCVLLTMFVILTMLKSFNNNLGASYDNNNVTRTIWNINNKVIKFLTYIFNPIYKYLDVKLNKVKSYAINNILFSSPKKKDEIINKKELTEIQNALNNINFIDNKVGNNNFKQFLNTNKNKTTTKQTKELINMFEQLNNIFKDLQP